jgi:hypothetical protein
MSDDRPEDSMRVGLMTGNDLLGLIRASRRVGTTFGFEHAYGDFVKDLVGELAEAEAELARTPDNLVVIGTIFILGRLIDRYGPAPAHYKTQRIARMEALAEYCVRVGLVQEGKQDAALAELEQRLGIRQQSL